MTLWTHKRGDARRSARHQRNQKRLRSHTRAPRLQGSTDKDAGGGVQRAP